ncbi:MAG TPA: peptidoglycan DD-metalloendopeptidase family protein [Peptococcaceae bacterium]|nr:peptidoglycan DD-metalloendopeptidase family protein [Peptococcaceae bacterium]
MSSDNLSKGLSTLENYLKKITDQITFVKKLNKSHLKDSKFTIVLACAIFLVTCLSFLSNFTYAVAVDVNGVQLGYAPGMDEAKSIIESTLGQQGEPLGVAAKTNDEINYRRVWISKKELRSNPLDESRLQRAITPYFDVYGLAVNGEVIAVMSTAEEIDEVLAAYQDYIAQPSETNQVFSVEIKDEVAKEKVQAGLAEIKTKEEVLEMLKAGRVKAIEYTVEKNDSLWLIARKNNMYTDEILAANPGLTEKSILYPGQVLKLSTAVPYLTVVSKGQKTEKETIPFAVVTNIDNSLPSGRSVVKQAGKDGEKEVTFTYTAQNGEIVEKTIVKETVLSQPVKQIIAQGPRITYVAANTSRGSGSISGLVWPLSGRISSYYGYRGGGFHSGIDINGSTGQPYVAAADGKVVAAGWSGNYGRMILIDHGNGVATRYAHSSQLLVSVGQTVSKGQTIGYVGSTGRSTGPHLHFEVIINGSTVNPLNYL